MNTIRPFNIYNNNNKKSPESRSDGRGLLGRRLERTGFGKMGAVEGERGQPWSLNIRPTLREDGTSLQPSLSY